VKGHHLKGGNAMRRLICNKKAVTTDISPVSFLIGKLVAVAVGILFFVSTSLAIQSDLSGPNAEFLNSPLAIKTSAGSTDLSIRLIEFLMGIQTDKTWEKTSNNHWSLKTIYRDPVIDEGKTYAIEFEKIDGLVVLSAISFNNRIFSYSEMRSFADRIIQNFGKHVSPK
jgi:hypothetical protein